MRREGLLLAALGILAASSLYAQSPAHMGKIYESRCANCHGAKADGVPKLEEMPGVSAETADAHGMASQEKANIYGPPLNRLSEESLQRKLMDFRSKGFESDSYHSVMRTNLKTIENREGDVDDAAMAAYIYNTFGEGAQ